MNILFTASECVPFVKTGGLADVVGALAPVLARKGHDVRVMLPLYGAIDEQYRQRMRHAADFYVSLGWRNQYCGVETLEMNGVTWYFLDNEFYFKRDYIYGLGGDEHERFSFFCRAALEALPRLGFCPDILHAHDWQSGMIPALLRLQYQEDPFYREIRTVFTIHNLQYQGIFPIEAVRDVLNLDGRFFTADCLECYGMANFMKAALVFADEITTVSPSYAEEIQTAYYGERLDGLLRGRSQSLSGVLNGIDVDSYDPARDIALPANYSVGDLSGRAVCKRELQRELGLNEDANVPLIGMVGRLSSQKGLDLVDHVIGEILEENVQLAVLGLGESRYVNLFSWAEQHYPGRVAARFQMDEGLARRIYAGADIFLMPSRFEPCGLSQMIALRYGAVPVVRETGGLRDTVLSYNHYNQAGNGFTFFNYNAHDMLYTLRRALRYYGEKHDVWEQLQQRGMRGDYSWDSAAQTYESLYLSILPQPAPAAEPVPVTEPAPAAEPAQTTPAKPRKARAPRRSKSAAAAGDGLKKQEETP